MTMLKKTYIIDDPLDKSLWDQMFLSGVFTDLVACGEPLPDDFLIWMLDQGLVLFLSPNGFATRAHLPYCC